MNYNNIYKKLFQTDNYNFHPDDELRYVKALEFLQKYHKQNQTIIDISSGRGIFIKLLLNSYDSFLITSTDIKKFHSYDINFIELDLNSKEQREAYLIRHDFLFAMDCLEHLDESEILSVLKYLSYISKYSFFTIANHKEMVDGIDIHRIQKGIKYWTNLIKNYFYIQNKYTAHDDRLLVFELISHTAFINNQPEENA